VQIVGARAAVAQRGAADEGVCDPMAERCRQHIEHAAADASDKGAAPEAFWRQVVEQQRHIAEAYTRRACNVHRTARARCVIVEEDGIADQQRRIAIGVERCAVLCHVAVESRVANVDEACGGKDCSASNRRTAIRHELRRLDVDGTALDVYGRLRAGTERAVLDGDHAAVDGDHRRVLCTPQSIDRPSARTGTAQAAVRDPSRFGAIAKSHAFNPGTPYPAALKSKTAERERWRIRPNLEKAGRAARTIDVCAGAPSARRDAPCGELDSGSSLAKQTDLACGARRVEDHPCSAGAIIQGVHAVEKLQVARQTRRP
jgi:hypothetical protein